MEAGREVHHLPEKLIEGMLVLIIPVLQVNAEGVVPLAGNLVNVFVAYPEFTIQISKAFFVLIPCPIKIHSAILAPLDDSPASPYKRILVCWLMHR